MADKIYSGMYLSFLKERGLTYDKFKKLLEKLIAKEKDEAKKVIYEALLAGKYPDFNEARNRGIKISRFQWNRKIDEIIIALSTMENGEKTKNAIFSKEFIGLNFYFFPNFPDIQKLISYIYPVENVQEEGNKDDFFDEDYILLLEDLVSYMQTLGFSLSENAASKLSKLTGKQFIHGDGVDIKDFIVLCRRKDIKKCLCSDTVLGMSRQEFMQKCFEVNRWLEGNETFQERNIMYENVYGVRRRELLFDINDINLRRILDFFYLKKTKPIEVDEELKSEIDKKVKEYEDKYGTLSKLELSRIIYMELNKLVRYSAHSRSLDKINKRGRIDISAESVSIGDELTCIQWTEIYYSLLCEYGINAVTFEHMGHKYVRILEDGHLIYADATTNQAGNKMFPYDLVNCKTLLKPKGMIEYIYDEKTRRTRPDYSVFDDIDSKFGYQYEFDVGTDEFMFGDVGFDDGKLRKERNLRKLKKGDFSLSSSRYGIVGRRINGNGRSILNKFKNIELQVQRFSDIRGLDAYEYFKYLCRISFTPRESRIFTPRSIVVKNADGSYAITSLIGIKMRNKEYKYLIFDTESLQIRSIESAEIEAGKAEGRYIIPSDKKRNEQELY